jgi:hypothetical protein
MLKIVRVKHDTQGEIIAYQLSNGEIVSKSETVKMVKEGKISGVLSGVNEYGEKDIQFLNGDNHYDKIDNLPEITGDMQFVIRDIYKPSETKFPDK